MLIAQGVQEALAEKLCQTKLDQVDDVWTILRRAPYTTELPAESSGITSFLSPNTPTQIDLIHPRACCQKSFKGEAMELFKNKSTPRKDIF